jgi:hypothetical protein
MANDVVCELLFSQDFDALAGEKVGPQAMPRIRDISGCRFLPPTETETVKSP